MTSNPQRVDQRSHSEQQREVTMRSLDQTKENVRRAMEEARKETPRFAQIVTDFQNETIDATREVTEIYIETHKNFVLSMQSAGTEVTDRKGYWPGLMQPWTDFWWLPGGAMMLPMAMTDLYTRMVAFMTMNFAVGTKIVANMMYAGLDATRATTRYAKESSREISQIMSTNVHAITRASRESVVVQGKAASPLSASEAGTTTSGRPTRQQ